jgi:signal transduction histidine kinase
MLCACFLAAAALAMRRRTRRQANEVMAVAAHELKSPLAALESYLALMEQEGKSGSAADTRAWLEDVAHMRSTAAHLRRTIGDILEMTRLDDARVKIEPREMDLAESARETAAAYQALAAEAGVKMKLSAAPARAWGDPTRVRQILDNLVANALRHAPRGGTVAVATGRGADGRAWCAVADDGKGVPKAQRARLFARFARLSAPLRGEPGTGLGLYIGRTLARAQGGELDYEPGPGAHGARFRLTLPPSGRA